MGGKNLMSEKKPSASDKPLPAKGPAAKTASVVLLVENELCERATTATHLRKSGFDVIEAADGEEARRLLDSVKVNVGLADLAPPGQPNGSALLRWLRERYPALKTIVTSGTETNLAALDGYGTFLSKPYRLIDLDYCLQKVLATASVAANEMGGAMAADRRAKTSPEPGKAQSGSVSPNTPSAPGKVDGKDDEPSMAEPSHRLDLSRRLAERAARERAVDPVAAKAARAAALEAYDRARVRRQRFALGLAVGAIACSGIAYLLPTVGSVTVLLSPDAAALPKTVSVLERTAATPTPAPPESTSPPSAPPSPSLATNIAYTPVVVPAAAQAGPAADSQQALVGPAPTQIPLRRDEARKVQARLRSFGFNPGPADGVPEAMTERAVMRYQQNRGQPQTGKVDRELLEQLRHDPAPKIVQRPAGPYARPTPKPRRSDPFEAVRTAGDRLGQWLDSRLR
jgi:DNA-binding response OmpR family regulator